MGYDLVTISEIIDEISMGPFGSNIKVECFVDDGIPVLNGSNVDTVKLREDNFRFVTPEKADSLGKANAFRGDIVVTHRGTLGQIAIIPTDSKYQRYVISQSQFRMRCNLERVLPEFVVYYFHTREGQYQILSNKSQVGVPALARPTTTFQSLTLPLPSLAVQKKIIQILSCLDEKIELNNRINKILEAQLQAIFKSWFVDFEPFQDGEFIDSELGKIPKGWSIGTLGEISDIVMGQSPSGSSYNENGEGMVFYQGRAEFGNRFPKRRLFTTEPKREAQEKDILLSVRAPVGDFNIATEKCCIGRGLASIAPKPSFYSYCVCLMGHLKPYFDTYNGEGTVFGSINKASLNNMQVIIPTIDVVKKFDVLICDMNKIILSYFKQNEALSTLRDTLLPKLMSGEIQIP